MFPADFQLNLPFHQHCVADAVALFPQAIHQRRTEDPH